MSRPRYLTAALVLALAAGATPGGVTDTIPSGGPGNIPSGSSAFDIVDEFHQNWDAGDDYACDESGNTLIVTVRETSLNAQACSDRRVTAKFRLSGPSTTAVDHPFRYQVTCIDGSLKHAIAFDENASGPVFTPINSGIFTFTLDGVIGPSLLGGGPTDVIEITTTEGPLSDPPGSSGHAPTPQQLARVPALGEWGGPLVACAIVALAAFLILRRRAGSGPASS
jgi:hypothetical protein